jgi:hypothetical protein
MISLYKYDTAKRDKLKVLSQNDTLQIVAIDQNDTVYVLGQTNFSFLSAGDATSGQALGDKNGFTMTFQAQEAEPARVLAGPAGYTGTTPEALIAAVFVAPATVSG